MEKKNAITQILDINISDEKLNSTLAIALRGARELSNRNVETGKLEKKYDKDILDKQILNKTYISNRFLATTTYLIIVDLIGNIFCKINGKEIKNDNYKNALSNFTDLTSEEIDSLKHFRNSLAHQFSLGNETEVFTLDYTESSLKVIELAQEPYYITKRGDKKTEQNFTIIYYYNICEMVENIFTKLNELHSKNELSINSKYKNGETIKEFHFKSMFFVK